MHVANLAQRIFRQQVTEILHQKKLQNFGVTNKEYYGMLWYF